MSDDIVERLKVLCDPRAECLSDGTRITQFVKYGTDARHEITRLRAENERLREALIRINSMATTICMKDDAGYGIRAESVMPIYETARAALEGSPK